MDEQKLQQIVFTYRGKVIGKPRMTQSDKWNKRPCVVQYHRFKDDLRQAASEAGFDDGEMEIKGVSLCAILEMPESWSKIKRSEKAGTRHDQKPDLSNIVKAVEDGLTDDDAGISHINADKFWDGSDEYERIEVTLFVEPCQKAIKIKIRKPTAKRKRGHAW